MTKRLQTTYPELDALHPRRLPDDLPEESAAAIANSLVKVAREVAAVDIGVTREMIPCRTVNVSNFVVTLPAGLTEMQRAELDYWLREISGNIEYAGE